ncbi:MAG TPA: hypothetical protein VFR58_18405 [Flavisolibacter sp.]|nr:hypothetical protein [Flavisolibacter sp.]
MESNNQKNRKTEASDIRDEAENAGRFAGSDADALAARREADENVRQDTGGQGSIKREDDNTNAEARRDPAQSKDYKGEAQNINDDEGRPLTAEEANRARNKATEGQRQGRDN